MMRLTEGLAISAALVFAQSIYVAPEAPRLGGNFAIGYTYEKTAGSPVAPLWGVADLHLHMASHLAFGGKVFWGLPEGSHSHALRICNEAHGALGVGSGGAAGSLLVAALESGTFGHYTTGYPTFEGWPRFSSRIHQQAHVDQIRRAWEGGLRLVVALAVQNSLLANEFAGLPPWDDMISILTQVRAIKELVSRESFMEVAYTPADARRIIGSGRLAVVLGAEVDSLGTVTRDDAAGSIPPVEVQLRNLRQEGIRHVFPVHLADNALGGTALYTGYFNVLNWHLRGTYFQPASGPSDVAYRLDHATNDEKLLYAFYGFSGYRPPSYAPVPGGHVNTRGLTPAGRRAVTEMMRLGIIIDTDHSSDRTFDGILTLAEHYRIPVVAGHAAFRELGLDAVQTSDPHKRKNEYMRTRLQLQRIIALGGMIGVGLNQGQGNTASSVLNDAFNTSKSFAQSWLYAVSLTGGKGIAIGTDFNGLAGAPGPRFGPAALPGYDPGARGQRLKHIAQQTNGVRYETPLAYVRAGRWDAGDAYTAEQRDVFEAIALADTTQNIDSADLSQIPPRIRSYGSQLWIRNIAKGIRATSLAQLPQPSLWDEWFNYNSARVQRAAYYAKTAATLPVSDFAIRELYAKVRPIYLQLTAMHGNNIPLTRSVMGVRDYDINIDGVAHMGMLPDFLQDLRNVGVSATAMQGLFRSAEDYVRLWELVDEARSRVGPKP